MLPTDKILESTDRNVFVYTKMSFILIFKNKTRHLQNMWDLLNDGWN